MKRHMPKEQKNRWDETGNHLFRRSETGNGNEEENYKRDNNIAQSSNVPSVWFPIRLKMVDFFALLENATYKEKTIFVESVQLLLMKVIFSQKNEFVEI
jgi:hypothetical protein